MVLLGGIGVVGAVGASLYATGVALHPAQQITAGAFVLLCVAAVALAPANGLMLLYLLPPLFNGEDNRPYFFLLEILVYLTILAAVIPLLRRRQSLVVPGAPFLGLFCLSALLSVPLNLNEMGLELQVASWSQILEEVRRSELNANLFYVRAVLNVLSGAALYILAANQRWPRPTIIRLAGAATLLYVGASVLGLWLHWSAPAPPGHFLTIGYGWGIEQEGFAGLGFNVSYFAQYALAYLPLAVLLLVEPAATWARGAAALALLLTPYTILHTGQRGALLVFTLELALLLWVGLAGRTGTGPSTSRVMVGAVACLVATAGFSLLAGTLGARVLARFRLLWDGGDSYRKQALSASWRMLQDQPVLGIGSGHFGRVFSDYDPDPVMQYGSLSAHNLYAQLVAEQGLFGLVAFATLLAVTLGQMVRACRCPGGDRAPVRLLLVSLASWLVYGFFQYTFLMRSMQVYFWITLGILVSRASGLRSSVRPRHAWLWVAVAVLLVVAGLRVSTAVRTPLRPGLAVGVYAWEPGNVRWTRGGAAFVVPVDGALLRLPVACPLVPVVGRAQTVDAWLDGVPAGRAVLDTGAWRLLEMRVNKPRGSTVVLRVRTAYTVVPSRLGVNADSRQLGVLTQAVQWARP